MPIKKQLSGFILCLYSLSVLLGCEQVNNNQEVEATAKNTTKTVNTPTGKPSAPIQFTHDYDGLSHAGELELVHLNFTSGLDGELLVEINSKDNITAEGDITLIKNVSANETITIPITLSLANDGKYYVNINAQLTTSDGNMQSKSFALAVSTQTTKKTTQEKTKPESSKNKIIVMDAKEDIRQD